MDLAHDGIRVNTITPCGMEHQLWTRMSAEARDPNYVPPRRRSFYSRDDHLKMIPLERFLRSSDLAWAAVFLASDESCFLTGIDIPVDGGLRHKYPVWRPGEFTGVNIEDYKKETYITEYGEPVLNSSRNRRIVPREGSAPWTRSTFRTERISLWIVLYRDTLPTLSTAR